MLRQHIKFLRSYREWVWTGNNHIPKQVNDEFAWCQNGVFLPSISFQHSQTAMVPLKQSHFCGRQWQLKTHHTTFEGNNFLAEITLWKLHFCENRFVNFQLHFKYMQVFSINVLSTTYSRGKTSKLYFKFSSYLLIPTTQSFLRINQILGLYFIFSDSLLRPALLHKGEKKSIC